jgi:hypothetical protein
MQKLTIEELHALLNDKTVKRVGIHSTTAKDVTIDFIEDNITTPSPLHYEINLNDNWVTVRWNSIKGTVLSMKPFIEVSYYKIESTKTFIICEYAKDEQNLPCVVILQIN